MPGVGGILDPYGGMRVIIGSKNEMLCATKYDELLLIVPDMDEADPPDWERIPFIVHAVERHIQWWISTRNDPNVREWPPIKFYLIRCRTTDNKRATNLEHIVMG